MQPHNKSSRKLWILPVIVASALSTSCRNGGTKPLVTFDEKSSEAEQVSGETQVLVAGLSDPGKVRADAAAAGISVEGHSILILRGTREQLTSLRVSEFEEFSALEDEPVIVSAREDAPAKADEQIYYLAKRDFDLPAHQRNHPAHDGRGVIVGVIDDGVSPTHDGLQTTTTGERKYLRHRSQSTRLNIALTATAPQDASAFVASVLQQKPLTGGAVLLTGVFDEARPGIDVVNADLNDDSTLSRIHVAYITHAAAEQKADICVDANANELFDEGECFGSFSETGTYGFWDAGRLAAIMAEYDAQANTLNLSHGERAGDSHGEGVASVLVGHRIGGRFDGVAPGAKMLDYDLSNDTSVADEYRYTMATFIRAFDWLGANGAEVINISYSLFFTSARSQKFMHDAVAGMIARYKFVISFSAGNNGPGLGSYNRGLIYPRNSLVAGAFASKDLDEYVHGVTGLPDPGRVIYYSSRGPSPDGGSAPTVISPLASLTHSAPGDGPRAFSGTSSASPALAGLAAVLISAAKQEGLPIDPSAVVGAITRSAVPLTGVSFVDQGAGLPKIGAALAHYRRMISGQDFARVQAKTVIVGPDGVETTGLSLFTSQLPSQAQSIFEANLSVRGVLADSLSLSAGTDLVKPVRVEYSVPWLTGATRSYLSAGGASISVQADIAALRAAAAAPGADHVGEIKLIDDDTGLWLHTIPVTVVDDVVLREARTWSTEIGPEDGQRFHFSILPGVKAFRVKISVLEGNQDALITRIYDPAAVSLLYRGTRTAEFEYVVPVASPGWHQLTFSKSKGTVNPIKVQAVITPIMIEVRSPMVAVARPDVSIQNHGSAQEVRIVARSVPKSLGEKVVHTTLSGLAETEWQAERAGFYWFQVKPVQPGQVMYWYPACIATIKSSEDDVISEHSLTGDWLVPLPVKQDHVKVIVACRPSEYTGLTVSESMAWHVSARYSEKSTPTEYAATVLRVLPGASTVRLTWTTRPEPQSDVELVVSPVFDTVTSYSLGTLKAL